MTGGRAIILGPTGRNFAAGMSGGIAYVYDPEDELLGNINMEMVALEDMSDPKDASELRDLITEHRELTDSNRAKEILDDWGCTAWQLQKSHPRQVSRDSQGAG